MNTTAWKNKRGISGCICTRSRWEKAKCFLPTPTPISGNQSCQEASEKPRGSLLVARSDTTRLSQRRQAQAGKYHAVNNKGGFMIAQLTETIDMLSIVQRNLRESGNEEAIGETLTLLNVYSASLEAKRNALL